MSFSQVDIYLSQSWNIFLPGKFCYKKFGWLNVNNFAVHNSRRKKKLRACAMSRIRHTSVTIYYIRNFSPNSHFPRKQKREISLYRLFFPNFSTRTRYIHSEEYSSVLHFRPARAATLPSLVGDRSLIRDSTNTFVLPHCRPVNPVRLRFVIDELQID